MAAQRGGANREAILAAAYQAVATLGYTGATTADICRRAGVSSGTFFHYFPTKEDVLLALLVGEELEGEATLAAIVDQTILEAHDPLLPSFIREVSTLSTLPRVQAVLAEQATTRRNQLRAAITRERMSGTVRDDLDDHELVRRAEIAINGFELTLGTGTNPTTNAASLRGLLSDGLGWNR